MNLGAELGRELALGRLKLVAARHSPFAHRDSDRAGSGVSFSDGGEGRCWLGLRSGAVRAGRTALSDL